MGGISFIGTHNAFGSSRFLGAPNWHPAGISKPSRQDESCEVRRGLDQILKVRLALNLTNIPLLPGNPAGSVPTLGRRSFEGRRRSHQTWSAHEKEILTKMMGLFESGDPQFAARHDEIYGPCR